MTIEARRAGSAILGLPHEPGEPVLYDICLEHDGGSVLTFAGAAKSFSSRGLDHLLRQEAILRIEKGPSIEVIVAALDGDHALLELSHLQRAL